MKTDSRALSLLLSDGKSDSLDIAVQAAQVLEKTARPRSVARIFRLYGYKIVGSEFVFSGEDVRSHLSGCHSVALLAVTLGKAVDDEIERLKSRDLALAHAVDAGGGLLAEQVCDEAETSLRARVERDGDRLTPRFSCGYGDFPLSAQSGILGLVAAFKTVGIVLNDDYMMYPSKSVTAVMGIGKTVFGMRFDCANCRFNGVCQHKLCARKA